MTQSKLLENVLKALGFTVVANVGFLTYYLPNTVFLGAMKKLTESYKNNAQVPVPKKVKFLFDEVLSDMKMEEDKRNIDLYCSRSFDFFHGGSIFKNRLGDFERAIIGIPQYFCMDKLSDEDKKNLKYKGERLDWSQRKSAIKFENTLFMSDKAKKFGMAQKLFYVSSFEIVFNCLITGCLTFVSAQYIYAIYNTPKFQHHRFRLLKLGVAGLSLAFNYTLWIFFKDAYTCNLEKKADEAVANLGKDYIEGGLEFFNLALDRNVALLNMSNSAPVTIFGNEDMVLRQKHLPLTGRRDYFQKLLEE